MACTISRLASVSAKDAARNPANVAGAVAPDCASANGAQRVFEQIPETDILFNNLGIYERKDFFDIPDEVGAM